MIPLYLKSNIKIISIVYRTIKQFCEIAVNFDVGSINEQLKYIEFIYICRDLQVTQKDWF